MKTALIIPFFNRAELLQKCLNSLPKDKGVSILLINDASTDPRVIPVTDGYTVHNLPKNRGIRSVMKYAYAYCFSHGFDAVINLDCDCIVTPDFFTRIQALAKAHPGKVISGFNSADDTRNPILKEGNDYRIKKYANGACLLVTKAMYDKAVKPALSQAGNWDFNTSKLLTDGVIVAKPSLVQHIGMVSSMGHQDNPDYAADFPKIAIPDVTLFGIDAHDPLGIIRAAKISLRHIDFGAVEIITKRLFSGREAYSEFCIKEMWKYVKTSHVLIIHADGYVQNPWVWNPEWLQYDYIGATWSYKDGYNVGNGGFSLRSAKLLKRIKSFTGNLHPEDCVICRRMRPLLEHEGFKFAPDEVANQFSIEAYGAKMFIDCDGKRADRYSGQFGFHGYGVDGLPFKPGKR